VDFVRHCWEILVLNIAVWVFDDWSLVARVTVVLSKERSERLTAMMAFLQTLVRAASPYTTFHVALFFVPFNSLPAQNDSSAVNF
jgi:hypothetical protein